MNHVRVPDDVPGFVRLQLADEVPAGSWIQVIAFRSLARRLLVPVLADVGHAELDEKPHVRGREGLGDRDHGDVVSGPASRLAGRCDPGPDGLEVGTELDSTAPRARRT